MAEERAEKAEALLNGGMRDRAVAAEERARRLEEVKQKVRHAIGRANGRWCEWGERAEMVLAMIEEAIGDTPPPGAEKRGGG